MPSFAPMNRFWIFLVLPLFLIACDGKQESGNEIGEIGEQEETSKSPREQLYDEVMVIHDESMLKMGDIYARISDLKALSADSLNHSPYKEEILAAITGLRKADDGMMDWMAQFKEPGEEVPSEEAMTYLAEEKGKIIAVDKAIDESLEQGQSLIEKAKND